MLSTQRYKSQVDPLNQRLKRLPAVRLKTLNPGVAGVGT